MEEMKRCPECGMACPIKLNHNFCSYCGKDIGSVCPESVVYVFVNMDCLIIGQSTEDISSTKTQNYKLVLAGYSIVKVFKADLSTKRSFMPIVTYSYDPGLLGQYHEVTNLECITPPTL